MFAEGICTARAVQDKMEWKRDGYRANRHIEYIPSEGLHLLALPPHNH